MRTRSSQRRTERAGERGSILVMTTVSMTALLLCVGLCVDVAHIFMVRTQLQNAADAAALAAVRELDSTAGGIEQAADRATGLANTYEFKKYNVTIPRAKVMFSALKDSGFVSEEAAKLVAPTIKYVRVQTQAAPVGILFTSSVLGPTHNVTSEATAGMSIGLNNICDYFPTAVYINTPLTGIPLHTSYKLQLTEFSPSTGALSMISGASYAITNPGNCNSGGCGGWDAIRDGLTRNDAACVQIDRDVYFSTAANNKGNIAEAMNKRFTGPSADTNTSATTYAAYAASGTGNDRRVLLLPVVNSSTLTVSDNKTKLTQFAGFFLKNPVNEQCSGAKASPDCAALDLEYIGNIVIPNGSFIPGEGSSSNLSIPVLYK